MRHKRMHPAIATLAAAGALMTPALPVATAMGDDVGGSAEASFASTPTSHSTSVPGTLTSAVIVDAVSRAGYTQEAVGNVPADTNSVLQNGRIDVPRNGSHELQAGTVAVRVPDVYGSRAERLDQNSAAFIDGSSATVVQPAHAGSTQILHVTTDPATAKAFEVVVTTQGDLTLSDTGGVDIARDGQLVGHIQPPRAFANGKSLPTRFVINGRSVKQITDIPDGLSGTVVIDHWVWDYVRCITGVGVPAGVAWAMAPYLPRILWNIARGLPPGSGTAVWGYAQRYGYAVWWACNRFLWS